ncbi:MAG: erythromycin esterase family protein [Gemmatimonadetes bacterium]|nr:erythromycin esterase family protein [Gemmatimonadota bacterium]
MPVRFHDRRDAGRQLAARLADLPADGAVTVVALPRGGVPVGAALAAALDAPLELCVVRKLGAPGHPELAIGAIAGGGVTVLHEETVRALGVDAAALARVTAAETAELVRREGRYRRGRAPLPLAGRMVVLVDDGLATGATMEAAIAAVRRERIARLVVAVPVAAAEALRLVGGLADRCVALLVPEPFGSVGAWYDAFPDVSDAEVERGLADAAERVAARTAARETAPESAPDGAQASAPAAAGATPPGVLRGGTRRLVQLVQGAVHRHGGTGDDLAPLLARCATADVVCLGEATHGTHEFYALRQELTRRLIAEHGFGAVAAEADWSAAHRVHRYVMGEGDGDRDAVEALGDFRRFPQWMWRNADLLDFAGWLRDHNAGADPARRAGFFGLDLYAMHESMHGVVAYLERVDPEGAARARSRFACFDHFDDDPQVYGRATRLGIAASCEEGVAAQLAELQGERLAALAARAGAEGMAALFVAEQHARVVRNAERYYRALFDPQAVAWNLRDRHMAGTLAGVRRFLARQGRPPRVVVWAHNSHVGDARATAMARDGQLSLGQLARELFGEAAVALVGFTTHEGTVTAADRWDGPARVMTVRPSLEASVEWVLHEAGVAAGTLFPAATPALDEALAVPRPSRMIGVIYRPATERASHYVDVALARQYDAVVHVDRTRAVEPLERDVAATVGELPETYPSTL